MTSEYAWAPKCDVCGTKMRPLFNVEWFCPREDAHVKPADDAGWTREYLGEGFDPWAEDTKPGNCPNCGSPNTGAFTTSKSHCWACGKVF